MYIFYDYDKKEADFDFYVFRKVVPATGFEPARREALAPKASVSTNSTTRACIYFSIFLRFLKPISR